jgi:two-component system chemotaxis response regulator CheY
MKILIVDDSTTMVRIISNTLKRLGYTDLVTGFNGIEGVEQLKKNNDIDLIITDWNMPEMNGLEFVKYIRKDELYKDTPIVMVTTEGGKAEVITALKAGVNNYIVKPFTPQVLKEKLGAVMGVAE